MPTITLKSTVREAVESGVQLNCDAISGAAFAVRQNEVLLVSKRSVVDLDRSEVYDLIRRVQEYADEYDNKLVDEFGGRLGGLD